MVATGDSNARKTARLHDSSVSEITAELERELGLKEKELKTYEMKLGTLIRSLEKNQDLAKNPSLKFLKTLSKGDKKSSQNLNDWLKYRNLLLYSGNPQLGEAQICVEYQASLREEIASLRETRETINGLLTTGLNGETRCIALRMTNMPAKLVMHGQEDPLPKISIQGKFLIKYGYDLPKSGLGP